MTPSLTAQFLSELEFEAKSTRRVLERVPLGRNDWKPHPKSMPLGYLAVLVATMPQWVEMTLNQDALDLAPVGAPRPAPEPLTTTADLLARFDDALARGRAALEGFPDEKLTTTTWKLLMGGKVVSEETRLHVLRHSVMNHWAHHRGQLTVYLRLHDQPVPSIYGPTADEKMPGA